MHAGCLISDGSIITTEKYKVILPLFSSNSVCAKSRWYDDAITMEQYNTNDVAIKYSTASSSSYHRTIVIASSYYPIFIPIVCRVMAPLPSHRSTIASLSWHHFVIVTAPSFQRPSPR